MSKLLWTLVYQCEIKWRCSSGAWLLAAPVKDTVERGGRKRGERLEPIATWYLGLHFWWNSEKGFKFIALIRVNLGLGPVFCRHCQSLAPNLPFQARGHLRIGARGNWPRQFGEPIAQWGSGSDCKKVSALERRLRATQEMDWIWLDDIARTVGPKHDTQELSTTRRWQFWTFKIERRNLQSKFGHGSQFGWMPLDISSKLPERLGSCHCS